MKKTKKLPIEFETSPFGIPETPGVYAVCGHEMNSQKESVLYIGSSKNMKKRVYNTKHIYRILFDKMSSWKYSVYVKYYETDDYLRLEKSMIAEFNPKYNKNGKAIH